MNAAESDWTPVSALGLRHRLKARGTSGGINESKIAHFGARLRDVGGLVPRTIDSRIAVGKRWSGVASGSGRAVRLGRPAEPVGPAYRFDGRFVPGTDAEAR